MAGAQLQVADLTVTFADKPVLTLGQLEIAPGMSVALTGPSGSGKTTLLHVMAGILRPSTGSVSWDGTDIAKLGEGATDRWRRQNIGLIFQDFHLIEQLTPLQNVLLPATFSGFTTPPALRQRATALLAELGVPMEARSTTKLSRGERQRVAVARALLFDPPILLADEPTASLDEQAAEQVAETLDAVAAAGRTAIMVSHDPIVVRRCARVIRLEHGLVVSDKRQEVGAPVASESLV